MVIFRESDMIKLSRILVLALLLLLGAGCVYYNTFYYARKAFNEAESERKSDKRGGGIGRAKGSYQRAIEKSDKVIEKYPGSGWYDDALFVNGVSRFHIGDYTRAEKRLRELLAEFPESQYAKEARVYLAKTKLQLGDIAEAMTLFEKLFDESKQKEVKAEAAFALGEYYYENKIYEKSRNYFQSLIDSLGDDEDRIYAQSYIADGYFNRFQFREALTQYLKILDYNPDSKEKYRAVFRAGECMYFINDIEQGMEYFNQLADDPLYYDSLGQIKLKIAEGYELDGDLLLAEEVYHEIAVENPNTASGAVANYNLGLIYQFDYEDYQQAKKYYDKATNRKASDEIYQDALQRSTDIGKLEDYKKRHILDTSATRQEIDSVAATQYLLGELYLLQLDKPDSAYQEFEYIIDNFPESYSAPKALIAMAQIRKQYHDDTLSYDSTLREVLKKYAHSDYAPEVIHLLGLAGTAADTGYPLHYFRRAEDFAFDKGNFDSAKYYYNYVVDSFPHSNYNTLARYASIWITEQMASPGDSSLYFAYADFADSFPNNEWAIDAEKKLTAHEKPERRRDEPTEESTQTEYLAALEEQEQASGGDDIEGEVQLTLEEKYFIDPDGISIQEVEEGPIRIDEEFRYPPAAYITNFEGTLYIQIKIDAFGEIVDYRIMNPSPSPELNAEVEKIISVTHFSTGWMDPEEYDTWFVYKYYVAPPLGIK